ncbi:MAG TPA: Mut7-C RNAse domain-containing protein [Candidatus Nitrosocosmicus sp.]
MVYLKFIADGMLGKIAKKLRIFGFDTEYLANTDDNSLIKMSINNKRTILTKDRQLYARSLKMNVPCVLFNLENELENLVIIMRKFNINYIFPVTNKYTRCTLCNGTLEEVIKSSLIEYSVPKKVFDNTEIFFKCLICKKIYWNGTHIQELNKLIDNINKIIKV